EGASVIHGSSEVAGGATLRGYICGGFGSGGSGVGSGRGVGGPGSGGVGGPGIGSGLGAGGSRASVFDDMAPTCPRSVCRTPVSSSRPRAADTRIHTGGRRPAPADGCPSQVRVAVRRRYETVERRGVQLA